jgi:hypothetical protein
LISSGRSCLTRSGAGEDWFKENNVSKEKLVAFWDWMLVTDINIETKAFSGFGSWINQEKEVISDEVIIQRLPETFKKSDGDIDWDYGFLKRLVKFAEINPENTLLSVRYFLLDQTGNLNQHRKVPMFHLDNELKDALEIIVKKEGMKEPVENLVSDLIEKGSSVFWGLKDVLK